MSRRMTLPIICHSLDGTFSCFRLPLGIKSALDRRRCVRLEPPAALLALVVLHPFPLLLVSVSTGQRLRWRLHAPSGRPAECLIAQSLPRRGM